VSRPLHRERQRDTALHVPEPFQAVTKMSAEDSSVQDHETNQRRAASAIGRLAQFARRGAINVSLLPRSLTRRCVLTYTWGKIPLWPRDPRYVVELDNPYVLALYGRIGRVRRWLLRRLLLAPRCAGIVCISDACRASTAKVLGEDVAARAQVVYPYAERREQASPGQNSPLRIVFVGSQFWLKGGFELCDAFASLSSTFPDAQLTVISNVEPGVRARFAGESIDFVPARLPRSDVADVLASADLFAMPTLVESFGMAALEALAHGLPILTTDVYALSELVQDGVNGVLLRDSFCYWRGLEANTEVWRASNLEHYVSGQRFPELRAQVVDALSSLLADRDKLTAMGHASRALFERRFSPEVREQKFRLVLESFMAGAGVR
jgi:glycosyltransferase involved in cell wall biosynthesis